MAEHSQRKKDINKFKDLQSDYSSGGYEALHKEIRDYIYPKGARFTDDRDNEGERQDSNIINSTATIAHRTITSGLFAGVTSPAEKWFKYIISDKALKEVASVKEYFDVVTDIVLTDLANSNFYTSIGSVYAQLSAFATAVLQIESDPQRIFRFTPLTIGQYVIDTDANGFVNYVGREYSMRSRNVVKEFGIENVSDRVKRDVEGDKSGNAWVRIIHIQEPNADRDVTKLDSKNKPFRSIYYEANGVDRDPPLRESGYNSQPFAGPRWEVHGDNTWGTGPGEAALGDTKALQTLERDLLKAIAKKINPPLVAMGSAGDISVNTSSNGITWVNGISQGQGPILSPAYQVDIKIEELLLAITQHEDRIKSVFLADLFFMLSNMDQGKRTAFEIAARQREMLRLLGPIIERMYPGLLRTVLARCYDIELELGRLPEPPEEIQGMDFKAEIISTIAMAQRTSSLTPMEQMVGAAIEYSQVFPDVVDKVNIDQVMDEVAEALGVPAGTINSDEVVAEMRRLKAEMLQEQEDAMRAQEAVDSAQKLSQTDLGGDNALSALAGR